ncbi:MAG: hypothetical protein ACO388_02080 [Saprospiraceae bacterium]
MRIHLMLTQVIWIQTYIESSMGTMSYRMRLPTQVNYIVQRLDKRGYNSGA